MNISLCSKHPEIKYCANASVHIWGRMNSPTWFNVQVIMPAQGYIGVNASVWSVSMENVEMIVWPLTDGTELLQKELNGGRELWRVLTLYDDVRKNWNLKLACAYADNQPGSPSTYFWLKTGWWNSQIQDELCMWVFAQMSEFSHEISSCCVFQRPNISKAEK